MAEAYLLENMFMAHDSCDYQLIQDYLHVRRWIGWPGGRKAGVSLTFPREPLFLTC